MRGKKKHKSNKIQNLVSTLAELLSTPPDILSVLSQCAIRLGCSVDEHGTATFNNNGKPSKKRKAPMGGECPAGTVNTPVVDTASSRPPCLIVDERTPDQVPPLGGKAPGKEVLRYLVAPLGLGKFHECMDTRLVHIARPNNPAIFDGWFGKSEIDDLLRTGGLQYTLNLNVTKYNGKQRLNFYGEGRHDAEDEGGVPEVADAATVWSHFEAGWSVRILHPQRWSDRLWQLMSALETYFGTCMGCNAYLTPKASQGFAPHWDDIDAFIVQLEGKKRWRLYGPRSPDEVLPRFSSMDLEPDELGELLLDVVLQPGDVLYMPRGTVHQAHSLTDEHSLHITLSVNQQNTWADFLLAAIPRAVQLASEEVVDLRRTMPLQYTKYLGVAYADCEVLSEKRAAFVEMASGMMQQLADHLPVDSTADFLAAQFLANRLPPKGCRLSKKKKGDMVKAKRLATSFRHVASCMTRIVVQGETVCVVHCLNNSRAVHAHRADDLTGDVEGPPTLQDLTFPLACGPALEVLLGFVRPAGKEYPRGSPSSVVALADVPVVYDDQWTSKKVAARLCRAGLIEMV